jgi:ferritin-like metal-binding protein YciE
LPSGSPSRATLDRAQTKLRGQRSNGPGRNIANLRAKWRRIGRLERLVSVSNARRTDSPLALCLHLYQPTSASCFRRISRQQAYFSTTACVSEEDIMASVTSWFSKMTGNAMQLDNLEDLLLDQLKDLRSAEEQMIKALPKMAEAAHAPELKQAFHAHLEETKNQKGRLDQAMRALGHEPESENCQAMKGLIAEGQEMIDAEGEPDIKDIGLIAAAQRVEHYEMAGYGCARAFAERLGRSDVARLLEETLNEERHADTLLTHVSEGVCAHH